MITNIMQIQSLTIGKRGETGAEVLTFDLSEFITRWGAGTATLLHKRPNDLRPYLVSGVAQSNTANTLTWTVSSADTAQAGTGELEIRWTITNGTAKSAKFNTIIVDALVDETTETPGAVVYMADGSQIEANKNDITAIKAELTKQSGVTTTTVNGYLTTSGTVDPPSPENVYAPITTDFIELNYNRAIEVTATYAKSGNRIWVKHCFYDENKAIVGSRISDFENAIGDKFTAAIKNTNVNVKYVRVTFRTNIHISDTTYGITEWHIYKSGIYEYTDYLADEIDSMKTGESLTTSRLYNAFVPRKPRFCFSKGKMWVEHWNTAEAYTAAGKDANCSIINGDVQVSKDGYFVMYHDDNVSARTDSTGVVMQMNWEDLQEVNITSGVYGSSGWTGNASGTTGKIPLLSDFLDICRRYGKIAFIEVKNSKDISAGQYDDMMSLIKAKGMQESVFISVANSAKTGGINPMKYLSENYPWLVQTAILSTFSETNINSYIGKKNMNISGYIDVMKEETDLIDYIRSTGKLVHVCANRPQADQEVKDAVDIGCDIIAVNHPIPESCL